MRTSLTLFMALAGAGLVGGCAAPPLPEGFRIVPKLDVQHAGDSASGYYSLGRQYHAARRYDEAERAYRQALALDKNHVGIRNALAILHAEKGELAQAVTLFQEVAASAPRDSQLHSNLGYALMLAGDLNGAAEALGKATALDPANARAWNNYGRVLEELGRTEQARAAFARVRALSERMTVHANPDIPIERRPLDAAPPAPGRIKVSTTAEAGFRTEIRELGPGSYELRQVSHQPEGGTALVTATQAAVPRIAPAAAHDIARATRLEISNGNGVTGMARMIRALIAGHYRLPIRVTNQSRFDVALTRIEYAKGLEQSAQALAADFGGAIPLHARHDLPRDGVRLILGKDMPQPDVLRAQLTRRLAAKEEQPPGKG